MKKRIVALLLCCVMLLTLSPSLIASASATDTKSNAAKVTVTPAKAEMPQNEKVTLRAATGEATSFQWQIQADDTLWVDISGETDSTIQVSYAMLASLLSDSKAALRCKTDVGTSAAVTVTVTDPQPGVAAAPVKAAPKAGTVVKEAEAIGEVVTPDAAATSDAAATQEMTGDAVVNDADAAGDEGTGENETPDVKDTCTIVIKYVYADGSEAANPWTATVAKGSSYAQDVSSPIVLGYAPDSATVKVNVTDIQEDKTITVTYSPALVNFTVKHYQQNLDNDQYTLSETETKEDYTNKPVGADLAKTYTGFTTLLYDTTTKIAADGSTVVEIYYDRNYYLMTFDLDGGYGVEPIYARYGSKIDVGTPTKAGYAFDGWQQVEPNTSDNAELPATMPAENSRYKAKWTVGTADFTVVFWYENADDDNYSYVGSVKKSGTPGEMIKSETYKNERFENRDNTHFTYNATKAEEKTVNGDGSTVLNVYFTRNTYTLTFKDGNVKITCGKLEHTHSHDQCCTKTTLHISCNSKKCPVGYEHEHTTGGWGTKSCYEISDLTITAKWNAKISDEFSKAPFTTTYNGRAWECTDSNKYGYPLQTLDRMPGFDATFELYNKSSNTKKTIYYYVQKVGTTVNSTSWPTSTTNFKLLKQVDTYFNYATYDEEYHEIQGFERYAKNISFNENYGSLDDVKNFRNNTLNLYYLRKNYNLKFYNHDAFVANRETTVQYEAPLSNYCFEPDYPNGLEPNAYVFDGWYTSDGCYDGSEVNWGTMTMPASDVTLYAKWVPKTHTVTTWLTKEMKTPVNVGNTGSNKQTVSHGSLATAPTELNNGQYTFVGWFYMDNGVEKAFDFENMPVKKDLNLYAKWSSNTLVQYTIKYVTRAADGTETEIAPPTTGSALAGTTKTFDAKTGTQLNVGYQTGYFPGTGSHSLTMDINGGNEFTFVYVKQEEVPYTVEYRYADTGDLIPADKIKDVTKNPVKHKTSQAVITEKFAVVSGYAPDAYQKRLVLGTKESENVIVFWYTKDEKHAPVHIVHWIQNRVGDEYTEYKSRTDMNGVIGQPYSEAPLTIKGFTYNTGKSTASGTVSANGLELNLYYDRNEYPYEFRFLEQGTNTKLAEPVTDKARYEAQVTHTAQDIPGYTLVTARSQAITIDIEDSTTAVKNVKTFYYTEQTVDIKYVAVTSEGGTLSSYQDNGVKVVNGTVNGSTPTAKDGFRFVGWFKDAGCTEAVDADWVENDKLTPQKTKNYGTTEDPVMGYEAATYYAKFEEALTSLTITKTYKDGKLLDNNQSAVFTVSDGKGFSIDVVIHGSDSVTINGLKVGTTYTVTEKNSWTWRYTRENVSPANGSITLEANGNNKVEFTNTLNNGYWLTGGTYCDNRFDGKNTTITPASN